MPKLKRFFEREKENKIRCLACSHYCLISEGKTGICGVRSNQNGELKLPLWAKLTNVYPDRIEKKPLYHFLPGTRALSIGSLGCNFACRFCQNWSTSQTPKGLKKRKFDRLVSQTTKTYLPQDIVSLAQELGCPTIAYTYNEPTVFVEYALETMILAKKAGLRNVWVSNGFMSKEVFLAIRKYLDAINIDLKSFSPDFYQRLCSGRLEPVLENIKRFWRDGIWVEVTTLVIPEENDSPDELKKIADFLVKISSDIPWHVTAFHPDYQMLNRPPTTEEKLVQTWQIGKKAGLKNVYLGNILDGDRASTFCSQCGKLLIRRDGYQLVELAGIEKGRCLNCNKKIPGVWV